MPMYSANGVSNSYRRAVSVVHIHVCVYLGLLNVCMCSMDLIHNSSLQMCNSPLRYPFTNVCVQCTRTCTCTCSRAPPVYTMYIRVQVHEQEKWIYCPCDWESINRLCTWCPTCTCMWERETERLVVVSFWLGIDKQVVSTVCALSHHMMWKHSTDVATK